LDTPYQPEIHLDQVFSVVSTHISALYRNLDRREPEESLVTVRLIVAVLNGFAQPVVGRSIANQDRSTISVARTVD
jgi:hypothetical protein